jgi:protein-S-isoprenylcysteine O-methyltransferase Ste14
VTLKIGVLMAAWLLLAAVFATRARLRRHVQRRSRTSLIGMAIQGVALALVCVPHRTSSGDNQVLWLAAPILAGAVWLMAAAVTTLGRQWSLAAEIQTHHALITSGPYAFVRHPIYVGTLGMLIGTGLIMTTTMTLGGAVLIYLAGTWIRVSEEERLLAAAFGEEYVAYKKRTRF